MQQVAHSRIHKTLPSLLGVEPDTYMKTLTHFTVSKTCITKFLWGDLGAWPYNVFAVKAIAPMETAPMTVRLRQQFHQLTDEIPLLVITDTMVSVIT